MPLLSLINFEIQNHCQKELKFNGVYSRNNLPNLNDGAFVINFDKCESIGTHWIALYGYENNTTYFEIFGVEHISKEIKKFIGYKKWQIFKEYKHTFGNVWLLLY